MLFFCIVTFHCSLFIFFYTYTATGIFLAISNSVTAIVIGIGFKTDGISFLNDNYARRLLFDQDIPEHDKRLLRIKATPFLFIQGFLSFLRLFMTRSVSLAKRTPFDTNYLTFWSISLPFRPPFLFPSSNLRFLPFRFLGLFPSADSASFPQPPPFVREHDVPIFKPEFASMIEGGYLEDFLKIQTSLDMTTQQIIPFIDGFRLPFTIDFFPQIPTLRTWRAFN